MYHLYYTKERGESSPVWGNPGVFSGYLLCLRLRTYGVPVDSYLTHRPHHCGKRLFFSTCLQSDNTLLLKTMKCCHACNKELSTGRSVARKDACPSCGADLHCCLNCALYERAASKQCREPAAELVKEKARANFCDFFLFREKRGVAPDAAEARRALDELFKK